MNVIAIRFNGEARTLARGLRVRSLLTRDQIEGVRRGDFLVLDDAGRERGLDGALTDGLGLRLTPRPGG